MTEIDSRLPAPPPKRSAELFIAALWVIAVVAATVQQGIQHQNNNFLIFRAASLHLLHGQDMYAAYPALHLDKYKYSPTFALLFAPFAYLPFALSFLCWTLLNGLLLWYAINRLLPGRPATVALLLLYLEVLLTLQYGQSNALVTALMILAFVALERGRQTGAAASITLGAAVKLFPLAGVSLAALYPRRLRFAAIFAATVAVAVALPLLVTTPHTLVAQYHSWRAIEAKDALRRGYSMMHYLHAWLGVDWPNWPVQIAGTLVLLLPLAVRWDRRESADFRRLFLYSLLVYAVLFNHASEPPTFIVAYAGIVLWYAGSPPSRLRTGVMALTLLVMLVADLDVFPHEFKQDFLVPYRIRGIPTLVAWIVMQWELLRPGQHARALDATG